MKPFNPKNLYQFTAKGSCFGDFKGCSSTRDFKFEAKMESSDEGLVAKEDASKQGRKIKVFDQNEEITLVDDTQGRSDQDMFDVNVDLQGDEVVADKEVASTADPITTAEEEVTTVSTTATITSEDATLA
ncbi:hypothetical protein Tco_0518042 [Tanacetum coccineum]